MGLVVLSSCSTESDPDRVLTDPDELVRAFLQAGVPQVIASRWNVDSGVAKQFTEELYLIWSSGKTPTVAAHLAITSIKQNHALSHPFYWASVMIFSAKESVDAHI